MTDAFSIRDRVAFITGSTRGLGKQIAIELARQGASVAMNYANNRDTADKAFLDLSNVAERATLVQGDMTDAADIARACHEVRESLGVIDILVLNATGPQPQLPLEEYDWAFFEQMHDYFVKSPVLLTKACLPDMKRRRWGRIIHLTSEVFAAGTPNFSAYVAAKGGQIGLARSLASELAPWGITVNMIAPGWIPVERHAEDPQAMKDAYFAAIPASRWGTPKDVAAAAAFFASEEASFITGQSVSVNGGHSLS